MMAETCKNKRARRRRIAVRSAIAIAVAAALPLPIASVLLCETALRVPGALRVKARAELAQAVAAATGAAWSRVEIMASDGARLRAWLFHPTAPGGNAVILLHGIADTRRGVLCHARLFLRAGYTVLTPDSRGHGESGGDLVTFGLKEAEDLHRWSDWLAETEHPRNLYGLGESLGAAILLQSLAHRAKFRAVVAECSFSDFRSVAYDRVAGRLGLGRAAARILFWPVVEPALFYARLRYGLDLAEAAPAEALRGTRTPVLLIHGALDRNIPPQHAEALLRSNPAAVTLWRVPDAGHTEAIGANPEEFARRVLGWLSTYVPRAALITIGRP